MKWMTVQGIINVALIITSVLFSLMLGELGLQLVGYQPPVTNPGRHVPRYYYKADPVNGHDIAENFAGGPFNFNQYIHSYGAPYTVTSNDLGCRDRFFDSGKDFVLLLGDSVTWGYAPLEQTWGAILDRSQSAKVWCWRIWASS
jgi:hypothetical protein